ncbi:MAG: hypothetical protein MUF43_05295, partial [Flavobacterium sp.]|nr:hypothetical protein [Flavobacterium sp.]
VDFKACIESNNFVHFLNSQAYDEVKKLAFEQNTWQENMVLVKKSLTRFEGFKLSTVSSN